MNLRKSLELLNLQTGFSEEELQKSYRELAKKYHPDNGVTGDKEKFTVIKEAYEFLIDSKNTKGMNTERSDEIRETVCPMCNGNGWRREKIKTGRGFVAQKVKCSFCDGVGRK